MIQLGVVSIFKMRTCFVFFFWKKKIDENNMYLAFITLPWPSTSFLFKHQPPVSMT